MENRQTGIQGEVIRSFRNGSSVSNLEIRVVARKPPKEKGTKGRVPKQDTTTETGKPPRDRDWGCTGDTEDKQNQPR